MKFSQENGGGRYRVCDYDDHQVTVEWGRVGDEGVARLHTESLSSSFALTADGLLTHDLPTTVNELEVEHLQPLVEMEIDVLLVGRSTAGDNGFASPVLVGWLSERGIGLEVMSRAAACRTYNLLMLEDRRVAAVLL